MEPSRHSPVLRALALFVVTASAAGVGVWTWITWPTPPVLEPEWTAAAYVLAGDGTTGARDGHATRARFSDPFGVAPAADGTVFVADGAAHNVRRISPGGFVSTYAAGFDTPSGLAVDADGIVYVADTGNNAIRIIERNGMVWTLATGFNGPLGVAVDGTGRVIVADTYNDRIRAVQLDGRVMTVSEERFDTPSGVAVDASGNIFVAETGADAVRMISPSGAVSTIDPLPADGLRRPVGIAVAPDGALYVTDDRGRVVEIRPGVSARTLVGSQPGFAEGTGTDARLRGPAGLALAGPGRLVVADSLNAMVRLVGTPSLITLRPPAAPDIRPAFDVRSFGMQPLLWPLAPLDGPFEITGTLGEPRGNDSERFHAGIDVHAIQGAEVRAVRAGTVQAPLSAGSFGELNESVRIGPVTYIHLRVGRDQQGEIVDHQRFVPTFDQTGRLANVRVKRGARFSAGETIGSVNPFNHVHLNVGWPGEEYNPFRFRLAHFEDTVAPSIAKGGIRVFREDGTPITERRRGRLLVNGRVRVIVDAWDQVDGNLARRRLGLYRLGYQVLHADGTPADGFAAPRETLVFDRLVADADAPQVVYASGSGIPFYRGRTTRFLYVVTSTLRDGVASPGVWDTTGLPPGDYTLRIFAADFHGNVATINRDLPITIVPQPGVEHRNAVASPQDA